MTDLECPKCQQPFQVVEDPGRDWEREAFEKLFQKPEVTACLRRVCGCGKTSQRPSNEQEGGNK